MANPRTTYVLRVTAARANPGHSLRRFAAGLLQRADPDAARRIATAPWSPEPKRCQGASAGRTLRACSARIYHRLLRISRTLADLDGRERLSADDIAEALQYRGLEHLADGSQPWVARARSLSPTRRSTS